MTVSPASDIVVLDEPAVAQRLHYQDLIPAIARALAALSSGKVVQPVRAVLPVAPHQGFFAVMPAYAAGGAGGLGAKLVTFYPKNVGVHTHHALIVMFKAVACQGPIPRVRGVPSANVSACSVTRCLTFPTSRSGFPA